MGKNDRIPGRYAAVLLLSIAQELTEERGRTGTYVKDVRLFVC